MGKYRKALESQLTPQQQRAAQLLVNNEWAELLNEDGRKKSMQDLADEIGIARSTLYEWRTQEVFVEYVNYLTDMQLRAMQSEVNVALMKAIRGGNNHTPSVKALDLYMRRWGLLTERTIVENVRDTVDTRLKTDEEIRKDIAELDDLLNGQ